MKNLRSMVICIVALLILASSTWAAEAPFYKGKTIRIVVGYSPGGGFDTFSRLIGRHLGSHLPGNPFGHRRQHAGGGEHGCGQSSICHATG